MGRIVLIASWIAAVAVSVTLSQINLIARFSCITPSCAKLPRNTALYWQRSLHARELLVSRKFYWSCLWFRYSISLSLVTIFKRFLLETQEMVCNLIAGTTKFQMIPTTQSNVSFNYFLAYIQEVDSNGNQVSIAYTNETVFQQTQSALNGSQVIYC